MNERTQINILKKAWRQVSSSNSGSLAANRLVRGSLTAMAFRVLGTLVAFGCQMILARYLGEAGFGTYTFSVSIVSIVALFAMAGFGNSLLRFSGEYQVSDQPALLRGVHVTAFATGLVISLVAGTLVNMAGVHNPFGLRPGQAHAVAIAAFLVPPVALLGLLQAALYGFKRPGLGSAVETLFRPGFLAVGVLVAVHFLDLEVNAPLTIAIDIAATILVVGIAATLVGRNLFKHTSGFHAEFRRGLWYRVSIPLLLMTGMQILFNHTDVIMLGGMSGPEAAGSYAVAARISRLVLFGLTAVNAVLAPLISELYHGNRKNELRVILTWAAWGVLAFTVVSGSVIAGAGRWILTWFGPDFGSAYIPLLVLLVGQMFNSLAGPVAYLMTLTGHQRQAALIVGACAILNVALNFLLIPRHGPTGAALATAITVVAWNLVMLVSVRNRLGINPTVFQRIAK